MLYKMPECSEEYRNNYKTAFQNLLKASKYSVTDVVPTDDGYIATVEIEPLKIPTAELELEKYYKVS